MNRTTAITTPELWFVVTCKGRRGYVERTAPLIVDQPWFGYCLVDYDCPERTGDWLSARYAAQPSRVLVERVAGEAYFHKTRANNLGAQRAIAAGAKYLCFADADTVFAPEALRELPKLLAPRRLLVASRDPEGRSVRSLTGVLVVPADAFLASKGYDEAFRGWGAEDLELRLRLHIVHGLEVGFIRYGSLRAIAHDDRERSAYQREPLATSSARNTLLLEERVRSWTGQGLRELSGTAALLRFERATSSGAPAPRLAPRIPSAAPRKILLSPTARLSTRKPLEKPHGSSR